MDVLLCLLFSIYLIPSFVAARREHERLGAVLALNVLLGWTGAGWLAALLWARRPAAPPIEPAARLRRGHLRLLESHYVEGEASKLRGRRAATVAREPRRDAGKAASPKA
jgi:hypothetical protein